jgi:hypothetical protein
MTLPPEVEPLAWLLGTWRGSGRGAYPTVDDFTYTEETTFSCPGKPFVVYRQMTRDPAGAPLHSESGYLRPIGDGVVEAVVAEPIGVVEVYEGTVVDRRLDLASTLVGRTPTAIEVTALRRSLRLDGDVLHVRVEMAAVGHPMTFHLEAELARVDTSAAGP